MRLLNITVAATILWGSLGLWGAVASAQQPQRRTWTVDPKTSPAKILKKRGSITASASPKLTVADTEPQLKPPQPPAEIVQAAAPFEPLKLPPLPLTDPLVQPAQHMEIMGESILSGPVLNGPILNGPMMGEPMLGEPIWGEPMMGDQQYHPHRLPDTRCRVDVFWARADYLHWTLDGAHAPPLVTSSAAGTARADAGILGLATTRVLLGDDQLGDSGRSGGRIEVGRWFPARGGLGWHAAYFGLDDGAEHYRFDSSSTAILARPFFSVEPAATGPNAELIALPGELEGEVSVLQTTSLEGAEFMFRQMLASGPRRRLQFVAGYQYQGLDDELSIRDFKRVLGGSSGLAIGTTLTENDRFHADNQFHGAALGVLASTRNCRWSMDMSMQLAFGNNHAEVLVDGSTTASVPVVGAASDVVTTPGGLLALGTNMGSYEDDAFAVVPQVHLDIGYDLNPQLRVLLGYRFLYWSQVARAAEQIDPGLNLSQLDPAGLSGEARPRFDLTLTDFWAQGLNVGLDYRF